MAERGGVRSESDLKLHPILKTGREGLAETEAA